MGFLKSLFRSWLPLGIAFALGTLFIGGAASAIPGRARSCTHATATPWTAR
jgi:hypothetical protein